MNRFGLSILLVAFGLCSCGKKDSDDKAASTSVAPANGFYFSEIDCEADYTVSGLQVESGKISSIEIYFTKETCNANTPGLSTVVAHSSSLIGTWDDYVSKAKAAGYTLVIDGEKISFTATGEESIELVKKMLTLDPAKLVDITHSNLAITKNGNERKVKADVTIKGPSLEYTPVLWCAEDENTTTLIEGTTSQTSSGLFSTEFVVNSQDQAQLMLPTSCYFASHIDLTGASKVIDMGQTDEFSVN